MSVPATHRQQDMLRFIAGFQEQHDGVSPSFRECALAIGMNKSTVHWLLVRLEERGQIRRLPNKARAIELITMPALPRAPDGAPLFFLPVQQGLGQQRLSV